MMERCILHSDLNSFYASVECSKRPELENLPVVVCGNPSLRHGIVLAKNPKAKACNITTGDTIQECRKKSKNVVPIHTDYEDYIAYSKKVYNIYREYSDYVENFGIDECWIDITDLQGKDNGISLGNEIKDRIKKETGITVSIGASFNKTFAKLGSDLAARDSLVAITKENYKTLAWNQPVSSLMYAGKATSKVLTSMGILTIGALAKADRDFITKKLGVNGAALRDKARGIDDSPVNRWDKIHIHKSMSSGITMPMDLHTKEQISHLIFCLCEELTYRMRKYGYRGKKLFLSLKSPSLNVKKYSVLLPFSTCSCKHIAQQAIALFNAHSSRHPAIRAASVGIGEITADQMQIDLLAYSTIKEEALEFTIDGINSRFSTGIFRASKLDINATTDYFGKHLGLHKVAFSHNVESIE